MNKTRKISPQDAFKLAGAHHRAGRPALAERLYKEILGVQPDNAAAHTNLGNIYQDEGRWEEAVTHYGQALSLDPDRAESHSSLGNALYFLGRLDEAMEHLERAVAIKPDYAAGRFNKSLADLLTGNYAEGWRGYEWRWRMKQYARGRRDFRRPRWDGSPLEGRTILLHDEQGFGDAIQFVRYAPMVKGRGGRVVVECRPYLARLFSTMGGIDEVVARGNPLPAFDAYAPLMSLPHIFRTTAATIPCDVPYLAAPAEAGPDLPEGPRGTRLKAGIVWAGSPTNTNDRNRSCRLRQFEPVLSVPGVAFYSLQTDEAAAELAGGSGQVRDLSDQIGDFADTAAIVDRLNLVISVDTAVVHVAGALGRPVWLLVPFAPDWRWTREGEDSPWYPTARLFRQPAPGDWDSVFARVAAELGREAAKGG